VRKYKTLGTITDKWSEWDDPDHKMFLTGLGPAKLAKLDIHGHGHDDRIYFYNDGSNPENSKKDMNAYLEKLRLLIGVQVKED
jgi:hypothetical protein